MALIDELKTLRVDFAAHENTTRAALYEIVGRCFTLLLTNADDEVALYDAAKELDVKITGKTDLAMIVVRIVFGSSDRRRESALASVLRAALADVVAVQAQGMAQWIAANGGLEAIRKGASKSATSSTASAPKSPPHLRAIGVRVLKRKASKPLATIPADALGAQKFTSEGFILIVGHRDPASGGINVVAFNNDEKRVGDMLILAGKEGDILEVPYRSADALSAAATAVVEA